MGSERSFNSKDYESGDMNETNENKEATVGDIKIVLMAIFSIKGNKRIGIQPSYNDLINQDIVSEYQQTTSPRQMCLPFGWINDQY